MASLKQDSSLQEDSSLLGVNPSKSSKGLTPIGQKLIGGSVLLIGCVAIAVVIVLSSSVSSNSSVQGSLALQWLRNDSIHCMDGTKPGYYMRNQNVSNDWIIFLEPGGSFCWDQESCDDRAVSKDEAYVTSNFLEDFKDEDGILSEDPDVNPFFYDHNVISIPYCTSDWWMGNAGPDETNSEYYLQGAVLLQSVIQELIEDSVLIEAETITLWGQGGGGYGVLTQADSVLEYLAPLGPNVEFRGVMDSSWTANSDHYMDMPCTSAADCQLDITLPYLMDGANPILPQRCIDIGATWECAIASLSNLENSVVPFIAFQWQYEFNELIQNGIMSLTNESQVWADYVADLRLEEMALIPAQSGYHYPNCYDHEILIKEIVNVRGLLDDASLLENVYNWIYFGATINAADDCGETDCNPTCGAEL